MSLGNRIAYYRKQSGLSQEMLAEQLGVSHRCVSQWESDSVRPDPDEVIALGNLFGVSADELMTETPIEQAPKSDEPKEYKEIEVFGSADPNVDTIQFAVPVEPAGAKEAKKEKKKSPVIPVIAAVLALAVAVTAVALPLKFGGIRQAWQALTGGAEAAVEERIPYPYVLVSGMGGWGNGVGINAAISYWGANTGSLADYLKSEGYEVQEATVGPFSSAWDRTCELYAQLTGTTVDYGEAHAKEHHHARYGRHYANASVPDWGQIKSGQRVKIHLIGHSFGGATVRLLASLLAYGDEAERKADPQNASPLFEGGKADWVQSVTALCAPHNGSSLTEVLSDAGQLLGSDNITEILTSFVFSFAGIAKPLDDTYDFMLDQFGVDGALTVKEAYRIVTASDSDNIVRDLSPDGAAALNERIRLSDQTYYFSYPYSTTQKGSLFGKQTPIKSTLPVLMPTAFAIGSYSGTTRGGIVIDSSWHENDGLVSVVSAQHPTNDPFANLPEQPSDLRRGVWYVAETRTGDHGTVIGLQSTVEATHLFYDELFAMLDGLNKSS